MSKPRIGITCAEVARVQKYLAALERAGAQPVPIPVGTKAPGGLPRLGRPREARAADGAHGHTARARVP